MSHYQLDKLQAINFRNLAKDVFSFGPKINCIIGDNGNGKTNLLEAIYYLTNRKSFRKNTGFTQLLSMDVDNPEIGLTSTFITEEEKLSYSGKIFPKKSSWYLNGKQTRKKENIYSMFINPFDAYAFNTTPSFRRTWFDNHFSIYDPNFKTTLKNYNQCLKQRNRLLSKSDEYSDVQGQVTALDQQIVNYSYILLNLRRQYIHELNQRIDGIFKMLFASEHNLKFELDSKFSGGSKEEISAYYDEKRTRDIAAGLTLYGIHKDDYNLQFDGLHAYDFCSLGQQKMAYLSLIFAYIELFRYKFTTYPIVLIDDISGELDKLRWKHLIEYLDKGNFQVLITTANESFKEELKFNHNAVQINIKSGSLVQ